MLVRVMEYAVLALFFDSALQQFVVNVSDICDNLSAGLWSRTENSENPGLSLHSPH